MTKRYVQTRKRTRNTYTKRKPSKTASRSSPITWLFGGILIGVLIPSIFYFKSHSADKSHETIQERVKVASETQLTATKKPPKHHSDDKAKSSGQQYDFYNLLSKHEDNYEEEDNLQEANNSTFLLEIASYKKFSEADQLKAQLVLMGIEDVIIKKQSLHNRLTYNVLAGPFNSKEQAVKTQKILEDNQISSHLK